MRRPFRRPMSRATARATALATVLSTALALGFSPLLPACGEPAAGNPAGEGLVVLNPSNPDRPFFHDMGTIPHGSRREWVVLMENRDPVPVTIRSVNMPCSCTRAKSVRLVDAQGNVLAEGDPESRDMVLRVPAGGRMELVVGVYTANIRANAEKLAILRLVTSSIVTPFLTFELHVNPQKLFRVTPGEARLDEIPEGYGGSVKVNIMTGLRGSEALLLGVLETSEGVEAELDHIFVNNENVWGLTVRVIPNRPLGAFRGKVVLFASDAQGQGEDQRLVVPVWAQIVEDIAITPRILNFGRLLPGVEGRLEARLRAMVPGARVKLLSAEVTGAVAEHLSVQFSPGGYVDDEGRCETWNLILFSDTEMPVGRFRGMLEIRLDDSQVPSVEREIQGLVP